MNISKEFWGKLKYNSFPHAYLCIMQTWLSLYFPAFVRLGSPWNTLISLWMSIGCMGIYISIYMFPELYAPSFNLHYLDDAPHPSILKKIHRASLIGIMHVAFFYMWYRDFYRAPHLYYIICYVHWVITFALIMQVINRYTYSKNS